MAVTGHQISELMKVMELTIGILTLLYFSLPLGSLKHRHDPQVASFKRTPNHVQILPTGQKRLHRVLTRQEPVGSKQNNCATSKCYCHRPGCGRHPDNRIKRDGYKSIDHQGNPCCQRYYPRPVCRSEVSDKNLCCALDYYPRCEDPDQRNCRQELGR